MSKQTAVDYLFETLCGDKSYYNRYTNEVMNYINHAYQKAKAMEREQMGLPNCGPRDPNIKSVTIFDPATGKTYTPETYKGGEQ